MKYLISNVSFKLRDDFQTKYLQTDNTHGLNSAYFIRILRTFIRCLEGMRLGDPENESHFHTKDFLYNFQHMHIKFEKNDSVH